MPPVQKRKRRVLTIKEKLESCELLKTQTYGEIARKYGIGESTIYVIKKQETILKQYDQEQDEVGAKVMKTSSFRELHKALFIWLRQMREKCIPVTGPFLAAKANDFYPRIYPDSEKTFTASKGFISNICK